jgi:hypothetical protein
MNNHFLRLRVVYRDLPNLIELGVHLIHSEWSAVSTVYTSPSLVVENGNRLLLWSKDPGEPLLIEAGADTGIGWMALEFYTIDRARHARCAIRLATKTRTDGPRPAETSRFAIELPTELGLIESFAREYIALGKDFGNQAQLNGISE